jgi:hypothetical protein
MPVSFSSPPRNLFLLGSSGADVVRNFFHEIDKSSGTDDVYIPDEIRYDYNNDRYNLAGTAQDSNSKEFGWLERRNYDPDLTNNPSVPTSTEDWRVKIVDTNTTTNIDTTLRAMESYGNDLVVVGKTGQIPWIAKYTNGGAIVWSSTSNTANVEYTGVCSSGGRYYACGNTPDTGSNVTNNQARAFVEKFDANGNPSWGKSAFMLGRDVVLQKISANSRDEVIAVGYLEDDTADKGYIVKINANTGEILWDRTLERNISGSGGSSSNDDIAPADVRCTATYIDGNDFIYVVGSIDGKNPVDNGVGEFVVKYSPEGNILWQRENHTDHYTNLDGAPNMIPFDVKSDTDTQQTVVLSVEDQGSFALNNSDIFISKYSKDGTLVFRRKISKSSNNLGAASLDADPSFYYVLFRDQQVVPISGTPDRYFFGKVSTSGNGLGNFQYDDGGSTPVDYTIVSNAESKIGRLSDGSVRNDSSDFITYPFTANKLVFDDLATPVSNKKRQMDSAGSFEYSGSPSIRPADNPILGIGSGSTVTTTTGGGTVQGQQAFTTAGSFTWTAPAGVTSVCVVCVGAGGAGGGALAYKNNITVVPGTGYAVVVGAPGSMGIGTTGTAAGQNTGTPGGDSSFTATHGTTTAQGGVTGSSSVSTKGSPAGVYDGGGNGGFTYNYGGYNGGGAGGYSGDGGGGGAFNATGNYNNAGGGGSHGSWAYFGGGGVGILGEGASGADSTGNGRGGSGGQDGNGEGTNGGQVQTGGDYGGGSSGRWAGNTGGKGAVRIIWGAGRSFPSTNTADVTPSSTTTTTKVVDQSGNGFEGTVNGATQDANGHWNFDGTDDLINLNSTLSTIASETLPASWEAWVYFNAGGGNNQVIIGNSFNNGGVLLRTTGTSHAPADRVRFLYYINGGNGTGVDSAAALTTGWHHIVGTYNGNGLTTSNFGLYIDGEVASTTDPTFGNPSGSSIPKTQNFGIGGVPDEVGQYYWNGKIAEVRVYPRALTSSEISQNYNATKSQYINEAPDTAPRISSDGIVYDNSLLLNYDFGNRATYDSAMNLLTNSHKNASNWGTTNATKQANAAIAPDGTKTATLVTEKDVTGFHFISSAALTSGARTFSAYCKAGTTNRVTLFITQSGNNGARFNLETGQVITVFGAGNTAAIEDCGGGWYRCSVANDGVAAEPDDQVRIGTFNGATNSETPASPLRSIYVWGPQVERRLESPPFAGRYIKTYGTTITKSTTVKNLSTGSADGTITGAKFDTDGYFEFDGTDDHIDIDPVVSLSTTGGFTVCAWLKMTGLQSSTTWNYFIQDADGVNPVFESGIYNSNNYSFAWKDNSVATQISTVLTQNQWHLICFGVNSSAGLPFIYRDGIYAGGSSTAFNSGNFPIAHIMGRSNTSNNLGGHCGEVQAYNRELSGAEVLAHFNATRSKYGV